jgi:hypothetical protein
MHLPIHICVFCFNDISNDNIISCYNNRYVHFPDGESLPSIPFIPVDILMGLRCPDCNVNIGGYHHPGCEYEICPRCGDYLLECGCLKKD